MKSSSEGNSKRKGDRTMKLGFVSAILDTDLSVWKLHAGRREKRKEDMPV